MTDYGKALLKNAVIRNLGSKAKNGTITARELNNLVGEYGKVAGQCAAKQLLEEFPNGHVSEDNVRRIISPIMKENHKYVSAIVANYQNAQFQAMDLGIKAVNVEYNQHREDELIKEISVRSFADELEG